MEDALEAVVPVDDEAVLPVFDSMVARSDVVSESDNDDEELERELDEKERMIQADLVFAKQQRVGPLLAQLRQQQEQQAMGSKEEYSVEHLRRLYEFAPRRPYVRAGRRELCKKVHEQPCELGCLSCHFCRQRTTERKTRCSRCAGRDNHYGGPNRGVLCGSCLSGRFGENIDEVVLNPEWVCPGCRDYCNCSSVNCMRLARGWFPTNQLSREALEQGYKSTAHYLILSHLSEHASVEDIGVGLLKARRVARRRGLGVSRRQGGVRKEKGKRNRGDVVMVDFAELEDSDDGLDGGSEDRGDNAGGGEAEDAAMLRRRLRPSTRQSQLPLEYRSTKTRRDALELASKPRMQREINNILRDLNNKDAGVPGTSLLDRIVGTAPGLGEQARFLCLLDRDDGDEEDDDDDDGDDDYGALRGIGGAEQVGCASAPRSDAGAPGLPSSHAPPTAPHDVLYADGGARQTVSTVSVSRVSQTHEGMRVCDDMLPPKRPRNTRHRKTKAKTRKAGGGGGGGARGSGSGQGARGPRAPPPTTDPAGVDTTMIDGEAEEGEDSDIVSDADADADADVDVDECESEDDVFWLDDRADGATEGIGEGGQGDGVLRPRASRPVPGTSNTASATDTIAYNKGATFASTTAPSLDEFVWNGLCLRATSVVEAVRTFYHFHPDVENSMPLLGAEADRKLYEDVYESTRSGLQRVLKSAEGLLTEEAVVYYHAPDPSEASADNQRHLQRISTVGGLRRAVQLFSFLSRILPEADVTWRIEKRLFGMEPFADFNNSSPHAKAVLLRGWLEFVAILEKRRIVSVDALTSIGNALGSIAAEIKAALPLLDAIIENKPMPMHDVSISGWTYDGAARGRQLVEVFTDLQVLYASLYQVFMVGIQRATDTSLYLGPKSHHMLTQPLVKALLDPNGSFPAAVVRQGFTLICTIIDLAFKTFEDESMSMTAEERNVLLRDRNQLLDFIEADVIPDLEVLVHRDYNMWGSPSTRNASRNSALAGLDTMNAFNPSAINPINAINGCGSKHGIGSEKVEVLARCYALRLRSGRASWASVEAKATEPYSFSQYWKYANLRYRHFSLYLLAHALERAPVVLQPTPAATLPGGVGGVGGAVPAVVPVLRPVGPAPPHLATILRMWLLSVLDFGRHECSWYLTTTISKLSSLLPSPVDFRGDKSGKKAAAMLADFGRRIAGNQALIRGMVVSLDDCLQERQREIVQTAFNGDRAVVKWHRATSRVLLAFLGELQRDMRRERELMKLLRRCVIWSIQDLHTVKVAIEGGDAGGAGGMDGLCGAEGLEGFGLRVESGASTGHVAETLEADLRQALEAFEFDRLVRLLPRELDDEVECHEPMWIFISGIVGLGDASLVMSPFERVVYDKVSAALFAASQPPRAPGEGSFGVTGLPLHRHVLGTHIRRILTKTNFFNAQNEKLGVNAMRFARAILSRPEMRAVSTFEGAFDMMLTTWISLLSQMSPAADSLAVRFELTMLFKDSIKLHGRILASSHLHREFWKVVCSECLRTVSSRFPEAVLSAVSMEAEFIYCHVLPTFPGLEAFVPSTPATLSAAYNNALSEVGRPPSFGVLDSVASTSNIADILPRIYGSRQREGSLRPGDFAWTLAKASIGLLDDMVDVHAGADVNVDVDADADADAGIETGADGRRGDRNGGIDTDTDLTASAGAGAGVTQSSAPGVWYPLCCMPYLESVARTSDRLYTFIKRECDAYFERLESKVPGCRASLPPKQERPARVPPRMSAVASTAGSAGSRPSPSPSPSQAPSGPLRSALGMERLDLKVTFAIAGKLAKVRTIQRDGVKVAACTLCDEEDTSRELTILVSKPDALVASLLDPSGPNAPSKLPRNVLFRGIELVKKTKFVARSTDACSMEKAETADEAAALPVGKNDRGGNASGRPTPASVFIEASKELVGMGYSLDLVTRCLQTLQRHASSLTKATIVRRVVSMLSE